MNRVPLPEFKAHSSRYLGERNADEIVLTKHGQAVAKLSVADEESAPRTHAHLIGVLKGKLLLDNDDNLFSTGRQWGNADETQITEARR